MVIVVGSIARCIIFGVPRLPIRPCDERPPAMYGYFCVVPRVSVHDRYYCKYFGKCMKTFMTDLANVATNMLGVGSTRQAKHPVSVFICTFMHFVLLPICTGISSVLIIRSIY